MTAILSDPRTYVSGTGIIEIHFGVENDFIEEKFDLYDYVRQKLSNNEMFETKFFTKNKETSKRYWLACLVCDCTFYGCENLVTHVNAQRHQKNTIKFDPRLSNKRKRPSTSQSQNDLRGRLLNGPSYPFLGLEFITEYLNPRNPNKDPQYTCRYINT